MNLLDDESVVDIHKIVAKSIYFGTAINVLAPMGLLLICYYINENYTVDNKVGDIGNILFMVLGALSIGHAVVAFFTRSRAMQQPMVRREETFEQDLVEGMTKALKPTFLIIASISIYGYMYFYLTGRFRETVFIVMFSFLVFQVVRPRFGAIKSLIKHQKRLLAQGKTTQ